MDVSNPKSNDSIRTFALLSIGEIGRNTDLCQFADLDKVFFLVYGGVLLIMLMITVMLLLFCLQTNMWNGELYVIK